MLEAQPTVVSLSNAAAAKLAELTEGRDEPGHRPARLRLLRRLLRLPLRDDARGPAHGRGQRPRRQRRPGLRRRQSSIPLIQGSEIDYVDTLMGAGFTVNNPNAVAACGCGSSFRTADDGGAPKGCSH